MKLNNLYNIINIKYFDDERGSLCAIESNKDIPFEIKRIYYIFNNKNRLVRGAHAHKKLKQVILCLSGSFEVEVKNGYYSSSYELNTPKIGLFISSGIWREIKNMTKDAVCCVIASELYDPNDYIHNYHDYLREIKND